MMFAGLVFGVAVAASVCALEGLRLWLERAPRSPRLVLAWFALLGAVFAALAIGGGVALAASGVSFLRLGLMLTGIASLGPLSGLAWHWLTTRNGAEMRHAVAQDL